MVRLSRLNNRVCEGGNWRRLQRIQGRGSWIIHLPLRFLPSIYLPILQRLYTCVRLTAGLHSKICREYSSQK